MNKEIKSVKPDTQSDKQAKPINIRRDTKETSTQDESGVESIEVDLKMINYPDIN